MASIKPIEGRSIHQIQSGQVIVDLSSVVKELVENSLDAKATSIEVRFKNYGLDAIEVQDNGSGIGPQDFGNIALKHYTSKLVTFDDISSLQTFGFRGEAVSSLCALSSFHIVTARAEDAPKGTKLDFEISGALKATSVVAAQKGTTVVVENLFQNLPVRKKELEKNIKREYQAVLGLLHAYACISTGVRFTVSNSPSKGKKTVAFATQINDSTRENIANVYGAKTLSALVALDLKLELQPSALPPLHLRLSDDTAESASRQVTISGHISRPVFGEGRQAPDRQMFFVNSRPCLLPQVKKAVNEVYKSFNISQSPFVFANLEMDTNAYDVNVSPDKRTILLHDQITLLEELKEELEKLFRGQDQTVPQARLPTTKQTPFRNLTLPPAGQNLNEKSARDDGSHDIEAAAINVTNQRPEDEVSEDSDDGLFVNSPVDVLNRFVQKDTEERQGYRKPKQVVPSALRDAATLKLQTDHLPGFARPTDLHEPASDGSDTPVRRLEDPDEGTLTTTGSRRHVEDFNKSVGNIKRPLDKDPAQEADALASSIASASTTPLRFPPGRITNAFDRIRSGPTSIRTATITIGDETTMTEIGSGSSKRRKIHTPKYDLDGKRLSQAKLGFGSGLHRFLAGSRARESPGSDDDDEESPSLSRPTATGSDDDEDENQGLTSSPVKQRPRRRTDVDSQKSPEPEEPGPINDDEDDSDGEYVDEAAKKKTEEVRVAKLIARAEEVAARPSQDNIKRATTIMSGRLRKHAAHQLTTQLDTTSLDLERQQQDLLDLARGSDDSSVAKTKQSTVGDSAVEQMMLTVSKRDFTEMRVIGQFNLGFILAVREGDQITATLPSIGEANPADELFIIDQHASDEKFNFERLQSETTVQHQKLVQPKRLDLTAVEEEIILNNPSALLKNGFVIDVDESGDTPTGRRCRLISLPMSKEVVFDVRDLEELLALLAENSGVGVPRPSKVRRMFAMRACRGSIMVGKNLTKPQMNKVVRHMGEIDKPWNCPHGRPTMRHLFGLQDWKSWDEQEHSGPDARGTKSASIWTDYLRSSQSSTSS